MDVVAGIVVGVVDGDQRYWSRDGGDRGWLLLLRGPECCDLVLDLDCFLKDEKLFPLQFSTLLTEAGRCGGIGNVELVDAIVVELGHQFNFLLVAPAALKVVCDLGLAVKD